MLDGTRHAMDAAGCSRSPSQLRWRSRARRQAQTPPGGASTPTWRSARRCRGSPSRRRWPSSATTTSWCSRRRAARSSGVNGRRRRGTVLDLAVNSNSERGLLGIALHPKFTQNGWVYLFWSESRTGADSTTGDGVRLMGNRIDRFEWDDGRARVRPQHHQVPRLPAGRRPAAARQPRRRRDPLRARRQAVRDRRRHRPPRQHAEPARRAVRARRAATTSSAARRPTTRTAPA